MQWLAFSVHVYDTSLLENFGDSRFRGVHLEKSKTTCLN